MFIYMIKPLVNVKNINKEAVCLKLLGKEEYDLKEEVVSQLSKKDTQGIKKKKVESQKKGNVDKKERKNVSSKAIKSIKKDQDKGGE